MGRTTVKATGVDSAGIHHTVTGKSGNGRAVWENIRAGVMLRNVDAAIIRLMFGHPDFTTPIEGEVRTGSSCAEPHAVSQLLAMGVALKDIKLEIPVDDKGKKAECHFCGRWIFPQGDIDEGAVQRYVEGPDDLPQWCY